MDKLDREYTLNMHKEMWHWIAEQYRLSEHCWTYDVGLLKRQFVDEHDVGRHVKHNCYCCQYAFDQSNDVATMCKHCPILWPSDLHEYMCENQEIDDDGEGLYGKVCVYCECFI